MSILNKKVFSLYFFGFSLLSLSLFVTIILLNGDSASIVSDSNSYITSSKKIINGNIEFGYRLPLYVLLIATNLIFFENFYILLILNFLFFLAICYLSIKIIIFLNIKINLYLLFTIIFFNPLLFSYNFYILPDIFFTLFLVYLFYLLLFNKNTRLSFRTIILMLISLVSLTYLRANAIYLIFILVIFIFLYDKDTFKNKIIKIILSLIFYYFLIFPFMYFNYLKYDKFTLVSPQYKNLAITDNLLYFKMYSSNLSREKAKEENLIIFNKITDKDLSYTNEKDYQYYLNESPKYVAQYFYMHKPIELINGITKSIFNFYFSNGYSFFKEYLNKNFVSSEDYFINNSFNYKDLTDNLFKNNSIYISKFLIIYFFVFLIFFKLLFIFGFLNLFLFDRNNFIIFFLFILYFTAISGFIGYSRYRLPIEPLLGIISIYGFSIVTKYLKKNV